MTARYAVYYCPGISSRLYRDGSEWLGYDAAAGTETFPELPADMTLDGWRTATQAPRKYGFHATLKPPFRLADGADGRALKDAISAFAAARKPFSAGRLKVSDLHGFLALTPENAPPELQMLAADCVADLDSFRRPATKAEKDRRRGAGLLPAQEHNLERWGYPFVMESFRFHMTLTGRLGAPVRERLGAALADRFSEALARPVRIDSVCLFVQPTPDSRFELRERFLFGS